MATTQLVITLLSDDKPGIVQDLADAIAEAGGNWLESHMSQLGGKFAGILKVSIASEQSDLLQSKLKALSNQGIQILIDRSNANVDQSTGRTLAFELIGADRIGIVSEIAHAFAEKGISINDLETQCSSSPWSGDPLFEATGVLSAPADINKDELLERLDGIEEALGIDVRLTEQL